MPPVAVAPARTRPPAAPSCGRTAWPVELERHRIEKPRHLERQEAEDDAGGRQPSLPGKHQDGRLARGRGGVAPRLGEEGDPVRLDKTGGGQRAGEREHGAAERKHQADEARRRAEALEQRLVGEPLADESVERRQGRDGDRADEEAERRDRHPLHQPAHVLHIARVGRMNHGPGAEEQERLEHGVIDRVVQPGGQGQRGEHRVAGVQEHQRRANAHQDDPDILDAVIGEQALEVVLHERIEHAQDRGRACRSRARSPPTSSEACPGSRSSRGSGRRCRS